MDAPRNYKIMDVELNWARLAQPVKTRFNQIEYQLQIATTDKKQAQEWKENFLNVKEKDGVFTVALKRKAFKADGTEMPAPVVVDPGLNPIENVRELGNESRGNVIVWQAPYDNNFGKGVTTSINAVQITHFKKYVPDATSGFEAIGGEEVPTAKVEDLF